jgi:hypothetical protein
MDLPLPQEIVKFEIFLISKGLTCRRREEPDRRFFGNRTLQYGDGKVGVQLLLDRSIWSVDLADVTSRPDEWYDVAILRDLLLGCGEDVLPLTDQIAFVQENWPAVIDCFGPERRQDTHARLALLRKERAKRRLPGLYRS